MSRKKLRIDDSLTDKVINKQKRILIIGVFCVLTLFISSSYALLTNFDKTDNVINFTTGNLNMTVTNSGNSLILTELNGKLPETNEMGLQNATPIVLTLTNTGTLFIDGYEVKLTKDSNKTSTLDEKYIKYAISEDGITYNAPSILTKKNNIIFSGYDLDVDESKIVYLKIWIDESAGNHALNKEYYGSVQVELYQKKEKPIPGSDTIMDAIEDNSDDNCNPIETTDDGTIYFSGDASCVDFNYIWYSGKMWRITSIYEDGTMKLITDGLISSIAFGENNTFYTDKNTTSYMYQWLNQEFLPTLYNYENIIVEDAVWNASPGDGISSSILPIAEQDKVTVNSSVGLLNSYEYYMSEKNASETSSEYLNLGYQWGLLNPYSTTSSNVWCVNFSGSSSGCSPTLMSSIRPSIILQSTVELIEGKGTESEPYKIKGDLESAKPNVTLINTRPSGEYVSFNEELYRIVDIEEETTKLIKLDYIKDENEEILSKKFGSKAIFGTNLENGTDDYWDYYLNKTWKASIDDDYEELLVTGTYYTKPFYGRNYKEFACTAYTNQTSTKDCDKTGIQTWTGYVGTSRYGEMFESLPIEYNYNSAKTLWLISPYSVATVWNLGNRGFGSSGMPSSLASIRPTIHLKSNVLIKSGNGTKKNPYKLI